MSISKATTKLESHAIITGIAGGFAVGHAAATFGGKGIGVGVGLAAAAVSILFFLFFEKHGEGLELPALVNLRGAGGALLGLAAGGISLYKNPMIDGGLVFAALVVSLFFFRLVKRGGES
jgi:hypothetical protein